MVLPQSPSKRPITAHPQKRRTLSHLIQTAEDHLHRPSKKQKLNHPVFPPPRFWDSLSRIPLTRNALLELNERNAEDCCSSARTRNPRGRDSNFCDQQAVPSRFARQGGPDLRDLRGYQTPTEREDEMSSRPSSLGRRKRKSQSPTKRGSESPSKSSATPNTTSTRSTGPYDRAFQQHLIDHGIFPHGYEYPDGRLPPEPENMDEIVRALAQPRASLSPSMFSNEDFRRFRRADVHASKEREVATTVIPIIEGNIGDRKCVAGEIPFTNLEHLTDGTLVPGNPDLYYGARPEQIDRSIRRELGGKIIPSTQHDLPIAPNFFLEVKGPDGSLSVASRQASYDGALGARAIRSLRSYGELKPPYDNNAHTITSIYHGGTLKMYTSHPISPSAGEPPAYVLTQIKTCAMTDDADSFRKGAAAYRNGRDWAKQQREDAIKQAHENATRHAAVASSLGDASRLKFTSEGSSDETIANSQRAILNLAAKLTPSYESDTSADELAEEFHNIKRPRSHSPRKKQ